MYDLERLGYLMQPHTSAGRIPTDMGYRFYVDTLLDSYELKLDDEIKIREESLKGELQMEKNFHVHNENALPCFIIRGRDADPETGLYRGQAD